MRRLLDTQPLLWWLAGGERAARAVAAIADPRALVVVSAPRSGECAIEAGLGKLEVPGSLEAVMVDEGFEPLPNSLEHAARVGLLPGHHRDPFARMLVAQAQVEGLTIVTRDPAFSGYGIDVLPC